MTDVEHKVAMHGLARARIAAGRPVWDHKLRLGDVFRNEDMTFEERRDAIVARIRTSPWMEGRDECDDLSGLVEELSEAEGPDDFDFIWSHIYDQADYDRVWIDTRGVAP